MKNRKAPIRPKVVAMMQSNSSTTHPSLLIQLRNRSDSLSWSRFARLYTPLLDHWIAQLGYSDSDRADIIQEVFVVLLGKISAFQYDPQRTFRGWLRTITLNKCRDHVRKVSRSSEPVLMERIERAVADDAELLTQQEYCQYVSRRALQLMKLYFSETTWRACWEHVAKGRPARDVAAELGITINAVYLARGRVLDRLRRELDGLWED